MKDRDFLIFIHDRLAIIHGENPNMDYMHKLRAIIANTPAKKETQNVCSSNNINELRNKLDQS